MVAFTRGGDDGEKGETAFTVTTEPRPVPGLQDAMIWSYERGLYLDGKFEVGPEKVEVAFHRSMMCYHSKVVDAKLGGPWNRGNTENTFELPHNTVEEAKSLLEWLYKGTLPVDSVPSLLALGRFLDMEDLVKSCARVAKRDILQATDKKALLRCYDEAKPDEEEVLTALLRLCSSSEEVSMAVQRELLR
jgi:hypothetical protein